MSVTGNKVKPTYFINSAISVLIMIFFRFLPAPAPITPYGITLIGIFIGAVYGWCTVSMIWPTLLALTMLGLTGDNTVNGIWSTAWGNSNIIFIFFLMIFAELLKYSGLDKYIAAWAISRKITEGRPYALFLVIFLASAVSGMVVGPLAAIIMFWTIVDGIIEELGYKRGDKLSAGLALGVTWSACIGSLAMPFQTTAVLNYSLFFAGTGGAISSYSYVSYLIFGLTMGTVSILVWMLFLRFIINPDVKEVKNFRIKSNEKLHMDKKQKMAMCIFLALVVLLLVPSFFAQSTNPILAFINKLGTTGSAALMLAVLAFVVCDGEIFASIPKLISDGVVWNLIFMLCAGLTIGGRLTAPETGLTPFLSAVFAPILSSVGAMGYLLIFMCITLVLTNCVNNVPVAAVLLPIQYNICAQLGMNPLVVVACFIFIVDYAIFLPSASPVGALLHNSDGRIRSKEIYKWAGPLLIIETLVMTFIGYPFGCLVF